MKAQQGGGLENYGRADQPTRAKEPKPEEEAVGGVKIGRSAAGALQDQSCRFKRILSARTARVPPVPRRTASPASRCTSHTIVFFMSKQLAALDSVARKRDRRCAAPQLRFRHVQRR
jgi:hypothetical protein